MNSLLQSGKSNSKSDEELIADYRSSEDPEIISVLFDRYSHLVFAVSMKYLKDEDDSKDVTIQIFEKLPKDLITYDIQKFSSWLHTVTKNYSLRFLSRKKRTVEIKNLADPPEEETDEIIETYLPHLEEAIKQLNDQQRTCIHLFYIRKMSYTEVSEHTGYSMLEVKSYIQNGKRNLKIILLKKKHGR